MSDMYTAIDGYIEEKLYNLHTCFIAKVVSISGNLATVKPLNMSKQYGFDSKSAAIVQNVPILKHVAASGVEVDNTVVCVCSERDITETRKGTETLPPRVRHRITDAILIGVIEV